MIEETTTVDEEVVEDPPLAPVVEEPPPSPPPEEPTPKSKSKARQSPLSPARIQRLHEKEELQVMRGVWPPATLILTAKLTTTTDDYNQQTTTTNRQRRRRKQQLQMPAIRSYAAASWFSSGVERSIRQLHRPSAKSRIRESATHRSDPKHRRHDHARNL